MTTDNPSGTIKALMVCSCETLIEKYIIYVFLTSYMHCVKNVEKASLLDSSFRHGSVSHSHTLYTRNFHARVFLDWLSFYFLAI